MTKTGILIDLNTVTSGSADYNIHYLCLTNDNDLSLPKDLVKLWILIQILYFWLY